MTNIIKQQNNSVVVNKAFAENKFNICYEVSEQNIYNAHKKLPALHQYESFNHFKQSLIVVWASMSLDMNEARQGEGTKDIPDDVLLNIMYNSIIGSYKSLNCQDIIFAFLLALKGELIQGDKPIDLNLYGRKFGLQFLTGVLNLYLEYKKNVVYRCNKLEQERIDRENEKRMLPSAEEAIQKEKNDKMVIDGLLKYFELYKQGKHKRAMGSHYYDFMAERGLISIVKGTKEWDELIPKAIENIKLEKVKKQDVFESRSFHFTLERSGSTPEVEVEIKYMALFIYFDSIITLGEKLEKYLGVETK